MYGFDGSIRLLEIADDIEELKTICKCGSKATQNLRLLNGKPVFEGEQVVIDDHTQVEYEGVCGECYLKLRRII
jgi:thymidine kinase